MKKQKQPIKTNSITLKTEKNRVDLWINFINEHKIENIAEVGVYKGDFAAQILRNCASIRKYYMIDPWRHLENWNKPSNKESKIFEEYLSETIAKTDFALEKRIILRGKTTEIIEKIPDQELDLAYIDGDHTLKGITIDLIRTFPKVKDNGWIGGDDFSNTIWQHDYKYEPTLVFPYAVYFAEAVGADIYALPHSQFLLQKKLSQSHEFIDLTDQYTDFSLKNHISVMTKKTHNKKIKTTLKKILSLINSQ